MKYLFLQAVVIGSARFSRGIHEVKEAEENNPHFLKFVSAGFIVEPDAEAQVLVVKSKQERAEALLEKIMGKKAVAPVAPSAPAESAPEPEAASEPEEEKAEPENDFFEAPAKPTKSKKK